MTRERLLSLLQFKFQNELVVLNTCFHNRRLGACIFFYRLFGRLGPVGFYTRMKCSDLHEHRTEVLPSGVTRLEHEQRAELDEESECVLLAHLRLSI